MGIFNSERLDDRRRGQKIIEDLKNANSRTLIIHYSCESFFNTHGRTPRVTSICVKNRGNNTTKTFSIHLQAQLSNKDLCCLTDQDFDLLEKQMLKAFYDFVKNHKTHKWVHWNMRNVSYGFEAIANRFKILGGNPREIEDQFKYDFPETLGLVHTYKFEKHKPSGQLLNLANRNSITTNDAMIGKDEAAAFDNRDYLGLHMSTCRKVEIIDRILTLQEKNKLKINANVITTCGLTPSGIIEIVRNNWFLFLIWSIAMAILGATLEPIFQHFFGTDKIGQ